MNPFKIQLTSGPEIYLSCLNQRNIYEGLLNGLPTTEMNARKIASAVQNANNFYGAEHSKPAYLIPPVETPFEYEGKYPFGTPAALPEILCTAVFRSLFPARDEEEADYAWLVVVWFQPEFALPIGASVLEHLVALDWDKYAHNDWY